MCCACGLLVWSSAVLAADWNRFRGPNGSGVSDARALPIVFGPKTNLLWKTDAPQGSSSPIVAGGRVWLAGCEENRLLLRCLDRKSGQLLWERSIEAARTQRKSQPNDAASSTPVTDGRNVYALFSGFGLVSYTIAGRERWRTPLGPFDQPHGMASSPILTEGAIIVLADQVTDSYIAAFDPAKGKLKWKAPRANLVGGYSTPLMCAGQLIVSGPLELVAYQNVLYLLKDGGILTSVNPENGEVQRRERLEGAAERYFASPVAGDAKVYAVSEAGKVAVIKAGAQWQLLAMNDLGEACYATPALAEGQILLRTKRTLWAFGGTANLK